MANLLRQKALQNVVIFKAPGMRLRLQKAELPKRLAIRGEIFTMAEGMNFKLFDNIKTKSKKKNSAFIVIFILQLKKHSEIILILVHFHKLLLMITVLIIRKLKLFQMKNPLPLPGMGNFKLKNRENIISKFPRRMVQDCLSIISLLSRMTESINPEPRRGLLI